MKHGMGEPWAWSVFDAKSRLSELIDLAQNQGPQVITRQGKPKAVILSIDDYDKLRSPRMPFNEFLLTAPLEGIDLIRDEDGWRDVEL